MNGWKNFATWYVYAHYISDDSENFTEQLGAWEDEDEPSMAYELQTILKEHVLMLIQEDERDSSNGIAADLAECFVDEVSFWEIAKFILANEKLDKDA